MLDECATFGAELVDDVMRLCLWSARSDSAGAFALYDMSDRNSRICSFGLKLYLRFLDFILNIKFMKHFFYFGKDVMHFIFP